MNTYPSYKDSGVEWIGEIPSGWKLRKIKYIFWERKELNNPIKSKNLISLTLDRGVIPHSEKRSSGNKPKEDLSKYKLVYPNDIVVNSMNVVVGSVGVSKYYGIVSPVYYMLNLINNSDRTLYFHHMFRTQTFQKSLVGLGNGILVRHSESSGKMNTIRMRIPINKLNQQLVPYPSSVEQQQISKYLDYKTSKIDNFIEKTEQKIELLKEQRTSLINTTITKGLNPNVEMKDSGVEWIGEIPSSWNLTKLKYESNLIVDGAHFTPTYTKKGIPFLRVTDIHSDTINLNKVKHISIEEHSELIKRCNPRKGDLLLSKNGTIGLTKVVDWEWEFSIFVSLCLIRLKDSFSPYLFSYLFQSDVVDQQLVESSKQSTVINLHLDKIRELVIFKPSLTEQKQIVEYLDKETSKIDTLIIKESKRIELLKEYRQSLISNVVTGKVDVRNEVLT